MDAGPVIRAQRDGFLNPLVASVQNMLSAANAAGENVALLLVHSAAIDRVDAQLGFNAGDRLSRKLAAVMQSRVLRDSDAIEALSRDEFVCVLRPVPSEGVAMLAAQRVMTLLGTAPVEFSGESQLADIAVGIAMFPHHGSDADSLLQHAK